jgi:hypothetical protein
MGVAAHLRQIPPTHPDLRKSPKPFPINRAFLRFRARVAEQVSPCKILSAHIGEAAVVLEGDIINLGWRTCSCVKFLD